LKRAAASIGVMLAAISDMAAVHQPPERRVILPSFFTIMPFRKTITIR
jgi:hypothetical protein